MRHEHFWHPVAPPLQIPDPAFDAIVDVYPSSSLTVICECGAVEQR